MTTGAGETGTETGTETGGEEGHSHAPHLVGGEGGAGGGIGTGTGTRTGTRRDPVGKELMNSEERYRLMTIPRIPKNVLLQTKRENLTKMTERRREILMETEEWEIPTETETEAGETAEKGTGGGKGTGGVAPQGADDAAGLPPHQTRPPQDLLLASVAGAAREGGEDLNEGGKDSHQSHRLERYSRPRTPTPTPPHPSTPTGGVLWGWGYPWDRMVRRWPRLRLRRQRWRLWLLLREGWQLEGRG